MNRRILWTGGFDSTWLIVDALLAGDRIEAVTYRSAYVGHIGDPRGWQKAHNEDEARRRILHALPSSLRDRLGFAVIDEAGRHLPRDVFHEPWYRLKEHAPFNARRYALWQDEHWEYYDMWPDQDWLVGCVPGLIGGALETGYIGGDSLFQPGKTFRADALGSLGLTFPLRNHTKPELLADARARGFAELLDLTWSCESNDPARTEPCGKCTPCKLRIIPSIGRA